MGKRRQLRGFDLKQIEGCAGLIGVDEAGRGALAGPVVAGAVLLTQEFLEGRWAVATAGWVGSSTRGVIHRMPPCSDVASPREATCTSNRPPGRT